MSIHIYLDSDGVVNLNGAALHRDNFVSLDNLHDDYVRKKE